MRPPIDPQYKHFLRLSVPHNRSTRKHAAYHADKSDALVLVAAFTLFLVMLYSEGTNGGIDWGSLNPASGLIEMCIVAFLGWLVLFLKRWLLNYPEDDVKLSDDYNHLIELYLPKDETPAEEGFVTSGNSKASNANMRLLIYEYPELTPGTKRYGTVAETVFPAVCPNQRICQPVDSVKIIDSRKAYEPPAIIQANFTKIISAHQESHMYNQTVIRVDDRSRSDGRLCMRTSRPTHFNSAATNRAMGYDSGEATVRKPFEYGPRVSPLSASKPSNRLGYNAFVITADGHVPFVMRSKELSIGKLTLGRSIGASVKSKYALGGEPGELSPAGLPNSVTREIEDELKVEPSEVIGAPQIIAASVALLIKSGMLKEERS